jgi:hypothetical protein
MGKVFELKVTEHGHQMHAHGFFVSLPGALLQRLLRRLQVLIQELA